MSSTPGGDNRANFYVSQFEPTVEKGWLSPSPVLCTLTMLPRTSGGVPETHTHLSAAVPQYEGSLQSGARVWWFPPGLPGFPTKADDPFQLLMTHSSLTATQTHTYTPSPSPLPLFSNLRYTSCSHNSSCESKLLNSRQNKLLKKGIHLCPVDIVHYIQL